MIVLQPGKPQPRGNRAIIAAGTGLGEAGLTFDESIAGHRAFASEGGHSDFSPRDDRELALVNFLQQKLGRTPDWENVLSGAGLRNLYDFLLSPGAHHVDGGLGNSDPKPADITAFQTAFAAHGPASIRKMLKEIPIRLIRSPENALYGAAHYASRLKV